MNLEESLSDLLYSNIESHGQRHAAVDGNVSSGVKIDGDRVEFFAPRDPQHELQTERPIHRQIVLLAMRGYTNTEIAAEMGVTPPMVGYTLLQPWAVKYMSENMHKHGMDKVEVLLKGAVAKSVERLIFEQDNMLARSAERQSAAKEIIDRVYGRAIQPIVHTSIKTEKEMSDAELDQEIERLRSQRGS